MPTDLPLANAVHLANTASGALAHLGRMLTLQLHETGSINPETLEAAEAAARLLGVADAELHHLQVDLKALYN